MTTTTRNLKPAYSGGRLHIHISAKLGNGEALRHCIDLDQNAGAWYCDINGIAAGNVHIFQPDSPRYGPDCETWMAKK